MKLLTVIKINARPHWGAAVHDPIHHQLSVHVLHVCRVYSCRVLLSCICTLYALCAPPQRRGSCTLVLFIVGLDWSQGLPMTLVFSSLYNINITLFLLMSTEDMSY